MNKNKKKYIKPDVIDIEEHCYNGIGGALRGAALMIGRSVGKAMGITSTVNLQPNLIQEKNK